MTTIPKLSDVSPRMADFAPERICLEPTPGTATKADVIEAEAKTGRLYELIDGTLVEKTVGFEEGYIGGAIFRFVSQFVTQHDLGITIPDGGTVELYPEQVRVPDVAFYSWDRFPNRQRPKESVPELVPDLAIEVLSPSNRKGEMFAKLKDYFLCRCEARLVRRSAQTNDRSLHVRAGCDDTFDQRYFGRRHAVAGVLHSCCHDLCMRFAMTFDTLEKLSTRFADFDQARIRLTPPPGTATKADVIEAEAQTGRLYELIDGTLVEKAMGWKQGYLGSEIFAILHQFVKQHDLGITIADGGPIRAIQGPSPCARCGVLFLGQIPQSSTSR